MAKLVRARTGFIADDDGSEVTVVVGEVYDATHPIVKRTPAEWWQPLKVGGQVEAATAAPGEKRAARPKATKEDE